MSKQIEQIVKILRNSNAVTYEPNARQIELHCLSAKDKFYVSEQDGHLTIDYELLAKALYDAGYRKASEVAREIFAEIQAEIQAALDSNYKARKERNERGYYDFDDTLLSCIVGKISALRGIDDFIDELKKKYTEVQDENS